MTKEAVDLTKLKEEIAEKKQNKVKEFQKSGGPVAKDVFLKDLIDSLESGQESHSSKKIKLVEQATAKKTGDVAPSGTNQTISEAINSHSGGKATSPTMGGDVDSDREEQLYKEFERKKKELLGEKGGGEFIPNNSQGQYSQPQQLNEEKLISFVKETINESFAPIVEQAMKDSIVEIYTVERIKEVIKENESLIRGIVINTIRELQKKKKPQS